MKADTLQIVGYQCDRCTRKLREYTIPKDYKEHLSTVHKIPKSHIPNELSGSVWEEEFVIVYKTNKKCYKCNKELLGCQYSERKDFIEYRCPVEDNKGHHHHNGRSFIGEDKKKYFCEGHGHNNDAEKCLFCDVEGSFNGLFAGSTHS